MTETTTFEDDIRSILAEVKDPEIPVLTVEDLGIIREIKPLNDGKGVHVIITPTYSGCPAMNMIEMQVRAALEAENYTPVKVTTSISPAWTTEWMSDEGKRKLKEYGISPPTTKKRQAALLGEEPDVECPHCGSHNTEVSSQYGSTPCKALYRCLDCLEPFDYFKCH
jgi:ring-1,2-phenylacetyl-CoA epoxidase subunit PaaD